MKEFRRFKDSFGLFAILILPLILAEVWPHGSVWFVGILLTGWACCAYLMKVDEALRSEFKVGEK